MKKMNKKGFTIVELTIVIAVIAILAAVLIPTFSSVVKKANESSVRQRASALYKETYALDIADGHLDGKETNGSTTINLTGTTVNKLSEELGITNTTDEKVAYAVQNSNVKFSYYNKSKGYTALFDGKEWTVQEGDKTSETKFE